MLKLKLINELGIYEVLEEVEIRVNKINYVIPAGFVSDLVTVPSVLDWYFNNKTRKYIIAALLHDYAIEYGQLEVKDCGYKKFTRQEADSLFFDCLIELNISFTMAFLMYLAVSAYSTLVLSGVKIKL